MEKYWENECASYGYQNEQEMIYSRSISINKRWDEKSIKIAIHCCLLLLFSYILYDIAVAAFTYTYFLDECEFFSYFAVTLLFWKVFGVFLERLYLVWVIFEATTCIWDNSEATTYTWDIF